ncbi:MAG: diguanylate cyclase [SAR324 cluster bacterium]|nr:diguanylate cyclase [SAR324 cluster bacterium]MBL7034853.1 diguanylate cyclase [SAR324 cluster bacterium]
MLRKYLSSLKDEKELNLITETIKSGRYFRKINLTLLKEMLRHGELVALNAEEYLIREEHSKPPELIVLLEGSLAVTSVGHFIMRLNLPGDVVGEMSVINDDPIPFANVIAEENTRVVVFPNHLFKVSDNDTQVSVAYVIFSHILAEKLRHTTALSLLKKSFNTRDSITPLIGIVDPDSDYRKYLKSTVEKVWSKVRIIEIDSYQNFIDNTQQNHFDFVIIDPEKYNGGNSRKDSIRILIEICSSHFAPILVISHYCMQEENRQFLAGLGVTDFLSKPFTDFELQHLLRKFRKDHYRQNELELVEIAADTDKLTGLANRRRMDEFLEALLTLYPEDKQTFSFIIADVDHFKHYNDQHGHQQGDLVLASVAAIFRNRIRRGDLAARFGGEEFVVILPNCKKNNAVLIAEKLCKAIAHENFPFQHQQPLGNLTCTFGVATFPDDAGTKALLLKTADKCLYEGKESGRNMVVAV